MRIVEICPFSSGICGVWSRVKSESVEFIKRGHEVLVLSSDREKGTGKQVSLLEEVTEGINIRRFKATNDRVDDLLSENVLYWFNKETESVLDSYNPDVIITHLLHPHSVKIGQLISRLKKKNPSVKVFIVPHAPFNVRRKFPLNLVTFIWRSLVPLRLNKFDQVIAIAHWEYPYLLKMGISEDKIAYIPNGLPEEFFTQKAIKSKKDILFLGRVAPVKNLELLIEAAKRLSWLTFSIVGAAEPHYEAKIRKSAESISNLSLYPPIYNLKEKIACIDNHAILVLPSFREAMPQVLLEGMARKRIVVASATDGGKEIIKNKENGFLFENGNLEQFISSIEDNKDSNVAMKKKAFESAKQYRWDLLINIYEELFK